MFQKKNLKYFYFLALACLTFSYVNCSGSSFRAANEAASVGSPQIQSVSCSASQDQIGDLCFTKCAANEVRNSQNVCVSNNAGCNLTTQDNINGVCVAKCSAGQFRNNLGNCENNPPNCNPTTQEIYNGVCVAKCGTNQFRNSNGQCQNNPEICNTSTHEIVGTQCLPLCASGYYRDTATLQCRQTQCSNGATNPPSCSDCGSGRHMDTASASCVSNSRSCNPQPSNSYGGQQNWISGTGWAGCTGYSCRPGYYLDGATCVKGCDPSYSGGGSHSWLMPHLGGPEKMCSVNLPRMVEGSTRTLYTATGSANTGFVKVTCTNSEYVPLSTPNTMNSEWGLYQLKVFRNQAVDISCENNLIRFVSPRLWGSCPTSSTATCYTATGSDTTDLMACNPYKVYGDDIGLAAGILTESKTMGQLYNTRYRIFIKSSKDGFASSQEITEDINAGYGLKFDVNAPAQPGKPPGFSMVMRKDMEGRQVKVRIEAVAYYNNSVRQSGSYETTFNVIANPGCMDGYDGGGVANFTIGNMANETGSNIVRRGYPWPLHQ